MNFPILNAFKRGLTKTLYLWVVASILAISGSGTVRISVAAASGPPISNIDYASSVGRRQKLEISFDVDTGASNPYFPYDASPPAGISSGIGITVEAEFSPDGWSTVYRQPAFYYQDFDLQTKGGQDWIYPKDAYSWVVRFSPPSEGSWQFRLIAQDASGRTQTSAHSFNVTSGNSKGFVRVGSQDARYFEFEDGSYFPGLGYNMNYRDIDWINPIQSNKKNFQIMGENGVQLVRMWLSQWSIFGAEWNPWRMFTGNDYFPATGLTAEETAPGSELSMKISADGNSCALIGWESAKLPLKRNTDYVVQVRYKTTGITGPQSSGNDYGFVAKFGGWLWGNDASQRCNAPGTGSPVTPFVTADSGDWQLLEGGFSSGEHDFSDFFYLALENASAGTVYIDEVTIKEDLGGGSLGPNLIEKPSMDHHLYFDQRNSFAFDKVLELAEANDVYLRPVVLEKNDWIFNRITNSGDFAEGSPDNSNFYGDWRNTTKVRWLQQAWWRYLQARWGYSPNIQSWELLNEGDPFNGLHYTLADEFGKYIKQFQPDNHLVSTSFWHSFPADEFWSNTNYPNIDFADIHDYIEESDPDFKDAAQATYDESMQFGAYRPDGASKPVIRGETGFVVSGSEPPSGQLGQDSQGIWLHNFIWGGINPGGLIESYWYESTHIYKQRSDGSYSFDHRPAYRAYFNFISDVPLSNGNYEDAAASSPSPDLRIWGQKDLVDGRAHLWIQNKKHTWKNVVDGVSIPPVDATVTIDGFQPDTAYQVEWWDPYETVLDSQVTSTETVTTDASGTLQLSVTGLTTDVAVKIQSTGSPQVTPSATPPPAAAEGWPTVGANPQRTSWTPEEVKGGASPAWYKPFEAYIPQKVQIISAYGTLYVSTANGLYALDAGTGAEKWVYPTAYPLGNSPTIDNGVAYVGGFDHMLHAIDAFTGRPLWTFEANQGFQTNPLVVGDKVFIGNRDGTMYAIGANGSSHQGKMIWQFHTGGPILYSAAYSDGKIYFASNDGHAYALGADNGSLIWKSNELPGAGFTSFWPVVYRDVVIFSGSLNYRGTGPGPGYFPAIEVPDIFPNRQSDPKGTVVGPLGNEPGDWVSGTVTIDTSKPTVTSNGQTTPITEYLESKPWRRTYFVLNASNGTERTYDFDGDGKPTYAPILWFGDRNGNRYPPVVGGDDVLYQANVYLSDAWIPGGQVSGWKLDTPYISRITSDWGAHDEPHAFSAGGNTIYWNLCCDREAGYINLSTPNSTYPGMDSNHEAYYISYNLPSLIPGYDAMTYKDPSLDWYLPESSVFGGRNGSYGWHGDVNPLIPYQGMLFTHRSNAVIALKPGASNPTHLPTAMIQQASGPESSGLSDSEVRATLENQIQAMINAGHLKPGYVDTSFFDESYDCSDMLSEYWTSPAETLYTLLQALPYLSTDIQTEARQYIQSEFEAFPPYEIANIGWRDGVPREAVSAPPEVVADRANYPPRAEISNFVWKMNPIAYYALWKYAAEFGDASGIFDSARASSALMNSLQSVPSDDVLLQMPFVHNAYIAGYMGYLELEALAGQPESSNMRAELNRLLALRVDNFTADAPDYIYGATHRSYCRSLNISRNFIFMVPELSNYLADHARSKVEAAVQEYTRLAPFWFVAKPEVAYGESVIQNLYDYPAIFQAKARVLDQPFTALTRYLDVPAVKTGDLFYIQNLVAALEQSTGQPSPTPTPEATVTPTPTPAPTPTATPSPGDMAGDLNGDGIITILDVQLCVNSFLGTQNDPTVLARADVNGDSSVDIVDVQLIVQLMLLQ